MEKQTKEMNTEDLISKLVEKLDSKSSTDATNVLLEKLIEQMGKQQENLTNQQKELEKGNKRVKIQNLMRYDIAFKPKGAQVGDHEFINVAPGAIYTNFTINDIISRVNANDLFFAGVDGYGTHAHFRICDIDDYRKIFNVDDSYDFPLQMTMDRIEKVLKIGTKEKFKKELENLVVTKGEAKSFANIIFTDFADGENLHKWQIDMINSHVVRILTK